MRRYPVCPACGATVLVYKGAIGYLTLSIACTDCGVSWGDDTPEVESESLIPCDRCGEVIVDEDAEECGNCGLFFPKRG